jgi:tRNA G18 (ribose-2'-O)-methylase SpoU
MGRGGWTVKMANAVRHRPVSFGPSSHHRQYHGRVGLLHVSNPGDPRIADYQNITDPALFEQRGVFIAEGRLVVRRLLVTPGLVTRSVMVTAPALAALDDVLDAAGSLPIYVVPQAVMNGVSGFNVHRGCLAIGERGAPRDWYALAATARRLVVLERVANADNMGAIFRNAAAFAADAVLLGPDCTDPLYRKAIRTSMGAALSVPFAHVTPWPEALLAIHAAGFITVGLTPCADARPVRAIAAGLDDARIAIVAGHEGEGLTRAAIDACDVVARIPMSGGVDSLNIATAVAIALYDVSSIRDS